MGQFRKRRRVLCWSIYIMYYLVVLTDENLRRRIKGEKSSFELRPESLVTGECAGDPEAGRQLAGDFNAVGRQLRQHTTTHLV